ncbi:hypothetical protein MPTK1_5g19020 [Marchantia polymorpha subsp. ruderalis]|uniref:VTT domain-containing protein n=2 Tax=Marchantia polymorpha TaxID=3197 RepID=A0AAF6BJX6_MARPO|nr:hypothetical protein MARPO_0073s0041 [Marchantia polymorpha]BBN12310.1 hypothetical protein Mp_5g19020 [Marchantia polymorpha subsp. ruderalis]|eukprot:PTQ35167.1 hypothetical protein MARPO_0073s0041 [Marchantia polymorpha]
MGKLVQLALMCLIGGSGALYYTLYTYKIDRNALLEIFNDLSKRLGIWAMPVFVAVHTLAIAMCFPYAVFFEAFAAFLFGFVNGVICVFSAKVLGAALAFWVGRALFQCSPGATDLVRNNRFFSTLNKGVAKDGWKFVLLARFSPVPSYVINYGLAATDVRFFVDFLLPTLVGGLPMILQNTSFGTLTSATIDGSNRSLSSYVLPVVGMCSGLIITWKVTKFATQDFASEDEVKKENSYETKSEGIILDEKRTDEKDGKIKQRKATPRE